jgi:hypothetical protein
MKIIKYLTIVFIICAFIGCAKTEDFNNTDTEVGHSRVTFFPTFTMKGEHYLSIIKGSAYSEPGVTAKEGDKDLQITTTGTVNVNTVGVYDIVYSATNKDNFSASVTRTIAVLPSAEQPGVDISGSYYYVNNPAYVSNVQKLAPGFYLTDNVWGSSTIPSYILTVNGTSLTLPLNAISAYGPVQGTGTLDVSGNLNYTVDLLDFGLTGIARKWKKQ